MRSSFGCKKRSLRVTGVVLFRAAKLSFPNVFIGDPDQFYSLLYFRVTKLSLLPHLHIWRVCFTNFAVGRNMELLLELLIPAKANLLQIRINSIKVPKEGFEPSRGSEPLQILSLPRLPVSPLRH